MIIRTLKLSAIFGLIYFFLITVIFKFNTDFESKYSMLDWCFRIVVIVSVSMSIVLLKKLQKDKLTIGQGFKEGALVSFFLAAIISISMGLFTGFVQADYSDNLKKNYREMQYSKMMKEYVYEEWKKDTITSGAIDTVNQSLDKFLLSRNFFFTNKGQVMINYIYCLFYGIITALTVSMLMRKE